MTRYNLLKELKAKQEIVEIGENHFAKIIQSGELANYHFDYNVGFYDVSFYYFKNNNEYVCRVWFGTIDDGDYGSWNSFNTKEDSLELLDKVKSKFEDISVLPSHEELNELFSDIRVYFCKE